jgi:hypothetical protein
LAVGLDLEPARSLALEDLSGPASDVRAAFLNGLEIETPGLDQRSTTVKITTPR